MTPELQESMRARFKASGQDISTFRYKTVPQGAATQVWCSFVAAADAIGGRYCEDCHVCEVNDTATRKGVRSYALDPARAEALWALSEKMVGEEFPIR